MKKLLLVCSALQLSHVALAQNAPLLTIPAPSPPVTSLPTAPIADNQPPTDYPGAIWTPAADGNFDPQNRPTSEAIDMVIVHDIEGPASAGINIFQTKGAQVSAHYVVGGDGQIYQMVREHNIAWHAGNRNINHRSIGIETEGYAYRPGWYNPITYEAEARLVRDITRRYSIPRDRTHIIGHFEVPNPKDPTKFGGSNGHTDPGPYWNWPAFMTLVRNDAHVATTQIPSTIRPGEVLPASVTFDNTGDDTWLANTASNTNTALQASGPIVLLGTTGNRISPFSSLKGWISPTLAAGALTNTLPGTSARFDFQMRGPRELGMLSEELRLTTVPTIAQNLIPVSFGDKVTLSTKVVPWILNLPAPDTSVAAPALTPATTNPMVPTQPVIVRWTTKLPLGGLWAVYLAPPKPQKVRKGESFVYTVNGAQGLNDRIGANGVAVAAKFGGKGWVLAGHFRFPEPNAAMPTVSIDLNKSPVGIGATNAGAVCLIGPFPTLPTDPNHRPELPLLPLPDLAR